MLFPNISRLWVAQQRVDEWLARQDAFSSGLSKHRLRTSSAATTIEEAQRGLSHQVRHQSRPANMRLKRPCRKLSFPASCQLPSPSALPSTRMVSSRPRRKSRKLTGRISTICCSPDILHVLGTSVHTWPSQRTSHPRSRTSVRQALRSTRRPAFIQTARGPSKGPTCALDVTGNLLQRNCPRHHRAPERQAGLACKKTTFRHKICASPGGHHHNRSESTPDKLSEEMVCRKRNLHKPSHSRA